MERESSSSAGEHGLKPRAYVCDHLFRKADQGFVVSTQRPDDPFPDAWCLACEEIRRAHGGWNDEIEKSLTEHVVCSDCYHLIRTKNQ